MCIDCEMIVTIQLINILINSLIIHHFLVCGENVYNLLLKAVASIQHGVSKCSHHAVPWVHRRCSS